MKDGILIVDKPSGITSFDVVAKIRRLYETRQVGHTGTLDPMASGVLVLLIGRAVKASEYAVEHDKTYRAGLRLGITSDTEDITGNILSRTDALPESGRVISAVNCFRGELLQIPPMYSALKRDGKKLYELARDGITVEREARRITVYSIACTEINTQSGEYSLDVKCSKGTYIRTLCADIGTKLGCGGVMSSLRRTECGGFTEEDAHSLDELEKMSVEERYSILSDTESLFSALPIVRLPSFFAKLALCGNEIYLSKLGTEMSLGDKARLYDSSFFSLAEVREYPNGLALKPIKKFRI